MDKSKLANLYQNIKPTPMLQIFEAASKYKDIINLGIGEPDFNTDEKIIEASTIAGREGFTHYAPINGFFDLREAVSNYWNKKHRINSIADEVLITVGGTQALYLTLQTFLNPGDEVIVTDPCFTPYLQDIEYLYGKPVPVPVYEENGFNLTAEELEKHITDKTKIILLNSPCNPSGAVMDKNEMEKIAKIVEKHDLYVISDEIYEAFVYDEQHISFATLPGMEKRTITVGGFSKTYAMTGWRIGYAIASRDIINVMKIIGINHTMCVNSMTQKAALYAIKNCEKLSKDMVEVYKERIEYAVERINNIKGISCIKPKGTFYMFANIKDTGMNSMEFSLKMIEEARVAVIPGIAFGENGEGYIRIACTVSIEKLGQAFDRIEKALNNL